MVEDILTKVARSSIPNSLEVWAALSASAIIDFAASMPLEFKIKFEHEKILKPSQKEELLPKKMEKT